MSEYTIIKGSENALSTHVLSPLDLAIAGWLDAKGNRTGSQRTRKAYADTLADFRAGLQGQGLELDGDPDALALALQAWAGSSKVDGREVTASTYNQRCAVISSFYRYAKKHNLIGIDNPAERVERRKVQAYGKAKGLQIADVKKALRAIDRDTLEGKRDYALIVVALETKRRAAELASLRRRDLLIQDSRVIVTWRRLKGGKTGANTLSQKASLALLSYLYAQYGPGVGSLDGEAPVWVSLSRQNKGKAISVQAISDICLKRLGVSRVHALRHTGALAAVKAGQPVSELQADLGHESLATTGLYVKALQAGENPYADSIAELFGVGD